MPQNQFLSVLAKLATTIALISALIGFAASPALAQSWSYNDVMPDVGAMSYDIALSKDWSRQGLHMTGFASTRGGIVRWVHCIQSRSTPYRICKLMLNGKISDSFALRPTTNLHQWLSAMLGTGSSYGYSYDGWPTGAMETSGEGRWGSWNAKGRVRYWR